MREMIEVKTSELIGYALDYLVGCAIHGVKPSTKHAFAWRYQNDERKHPSTEWRHGGPLIAGFAIGFVGHDADNWLAISSPEDVEYRGVGETHLIAACRLIVMSKLGETVLVPKELVR